MQQCMQTACWEAVHWSWPAKTNVRPAHWRFYLIFMTLVTLVWYIHCLHYISWCFSQNSHTFDGDQKFPENYIYVQLLQLFQPSVIPGSVRLTFWMPFSRAIPWNTLISNSNGKMLDAKSWAWRISIFLLRTCVCFCRLWLTTMFPFRYI